MATKLNFRDRKNLYEKGWFPVPTVNRYVIKNYLSGFFKVERLKKDFRTQLYISLTPKCLKYYRTKLPKDLQIEACFNENQKMSAKDEKLKEQLKNVYAQYIYQKFLKPKLCRDRKKVSFELFA